MQSQDSLVADERGAVDLLDQRVVIAADSAAHSVLPLQTTVVQTVLHHKVHRSAGVEIHSQVLEVVQHVRVLDERDASSAPIAVESNATCETMLKKKKKTYVRHGEFLVQSNLYFIHHSNTEGEHPHKHGHLNKGKKHL